MALELSDVTPYLPLASTAISMLVSAIEAAIAAHSAGDPVAAKAALDQCIVDVGVLVADMPNELAKVDADVAAARDAKFPASPLAPAQAAVLERVKSIAAALSPPARVTGEP